MGPVMLHSLQTLFVSLELLLFAIVTASNALEVLLPNRNSVWVANGKTRQVVFRCHAGEDSASWRVEILDANGASVAKFPNEILLAESNVGGAFKYKTKVGVPEDVASGTYSVLVCGATQDTKTCTRSGEFHIEGTPPPGIDSDVLEPHEQRFHARRERLEEFLMSVDLEELWPLHGTHCSIPRIHKPSNEEFVEKFMKPGRPCIISGMMEDWDAMKKWQFEEFQDDPRIADGVAIGQRQELVPLRLYTRYLRERSIKDLVPWMVFMPDVFDVYPDLRQDYKLPDFFSEEYDFMRHVEDELRMDWRWIIMAPKRSGSGWHVDPANTTGWLALVTGAKLWGMYPPTTPHVPGVKNNFYQTRDYKMEDAFYWWFYTRPHLVIELFRWPSGQAGRSLIRGRWEDYCAVGRSNLPIECVQKPGDIVFIPSGWWHSVLNLDHTIAVTQNFCNKYSLRNCLTELREQADSDGSFIGRTFEKLRDLYAQSHPQFFEEEDVVFEAPVQGEGLTDSEDKERRLENLHEFLAGKRPFVESDF